MLPAMTPTAPIQPPPWKPPMPLPEAFHTDRLTLRFWQHEDAQGLFELVSTGRNHLLPWLPWAKSDHSRVEESTFYIEKCIRTRREPHPTDFSIGIFDRASNRPIGGTGFHRLESAVHEAEIGYFIREEEAGKGLCTEATRAMLTWALRSQSEGGWGFRRIHIRCAGRNIASAKVCRKLGLRQEATLVKDRWVDGIGWDDTLVFGVLADEWKG
jgi:RimJ/RimL family protein N-acetyltransferase